MKKLILVDVDGVLAAFDSHFWERCAENGWEFDIDHPSQQVKRYFTDHIPDRIHRKLARAMVDGTRWFKDLPLVDGAQDGLNELAKQAEVWICSKPLDADPYCLQDKRDWIGRHFPKFVDRLILAGDKSLIKGDILLDDAPKLKWLDRAEWTPIIYTQPFNSHDGSDLKDFPHFDWSQPVERLLEMADA